MTRTKQSGVTIKKEDKWLIIKAAKIEHRSFSNFVTTAAIEKAKNILNK